MASAVAGGSLGTGIAALWLEAPGDHAHSATAASTQPRWSWGRCWHAGLALEDDQFKQRDQAFAVGVQKAVVAASPEAFGQDVLEHQLEEVGAADGAAHHLFGFAVAPSVGDVAILAADDVLFLNDTAVQVSAQVDQGFAAIAHALEIDDPFVGHACGQTQTQLAQGIEHLGPKHLGQGLVALKMACRMESLASFAVLHAAV